MTNSQIIALRCAASLRQHLLTHRYIDERRDKYLYRYNIANYKGSRWLTKAVLDQLDRCKSEEARRLILGKSR